MTKILIGLIGKSGSGKTTMSSLLSDTYTEYSFALPLKKSMATLFSIGPDEEHDVFFSCKKDTHILYDGRSVRHMMQAYGDMMLKTFGDGIFIELLHRRLSADKRDNVIVSDVRYKREADYITQQGGILIKLLRDDVDTITGDCKVHRTEQEWMTIECDYVIENNGSLSEFEEKVRTMTSNIHV